MAIYYGSIEVKIIKYLDKDEVKIQYDDIFMEVPVIELEADGGIEEIHNTLHELKEGLNQD